MDARGGERVNGRRWAHNHPQATSTMTPVMAESRCRPIPIGISTDRGGYLRLHADCGRAEFDADIQLIRVACPALLCGSVPVADNQIGAHLTWDARPCQWSEWRIVDDSVPVVRPVS